VFPLLFYTHHSFEPRYLVSLGLLRLKPIKMDEPEQRIQETLDFVDAVLDSQLPLNERQYYEDLRAKLYPKLVQQQQYQLQQQEYQQQQQEYQQQQQEYQQQHHEYQQHQYQQQQYPQQQYQQQQQQQAAPAGHTEYYDHFADLMAQAGAQMPSPPSAEPSLNRKRGLGTTDYPEAKRVSAQPSPTSSGTPPAYHWTLPSRQSNPVGVVDLTESDPPTPESDPEPPQYQQLSDPFVDPFSEFNDAYRGGGVGLDPADAFNQDFMGRQELAAFMMEPTRQTDSYALHPPREIPYPMFGADDSDTDEYGTISGLEADAIDTLLENVKEHGEKPEDRAPTPASMTCTLKEYQRIGLSWLIKMEEGHAKGGILADEMGLGKTVS
jgi:hypothetical protein